MESENVRQRQLLIKNCSPSHIGEIAQEFEFAVYGDKWPDMPLQITPNATKVEIIFWGEWQGRASMPYSHPETGKLGYPARDGTYGFARAIAVDRDRTQLSVYSRPASWPELQSEWQRFEDHLRALGLLTSHGTVVSDQSVDQEDVMVISDERKEIELLFYIWRDSGRNLYKEVWLLAAVKGSFFETNIQEMLRALHSLEAHGLVTKKSPEDGWGIQPSRSAAGFHIFITQKGIDLINELRAGDLGRCFSEDDLVIDWSKVETAVSKHPENNPQKLKGPQIIALGKKISDVYKIDELYALARKLSTDYENLPGETRDRKAQELVDYANRHGKVSELLDILREERPRVNWLDYLI